MVGPCLPGAVTKQIFCKHLNPLECTVNCSAISNNMKLVHWPLMGGLLHLVQRGGAWAGCSPAQSPPHCTKYNSTAHPSTASVPITVLLYNCPLLYGFNVHTKGLRYVSFSHIHITNYCSKMIWIQYVKATVGLPGHPDRRWHPK